MVASGAPVDDSNLLPIDERTSETAGSDADGNGFLDVFATGSPWLSGRRPGAFIGSPSSAEGSRFGNFGADTIVNIPGGLEIGSTLPTGEFFGIGGLQEPVSPLKNAFIHRGRVYEAFRFAFVYDAANGAIDVLLNRVVTNVYTSATSGLNEFIASDVENARLIPAPGVVVPGVAFAAFGRRRRPPHRAA